MIVRTFSKNEEVKKKKKQKRNQVKNKRKNIKMEKRRKANIVIGRRSLQTFDCSATPETTMIILCYIRLRFCLYYFL
jgi:hypothetical protein